ncbi:MAG: PfkB family carbohydrate kinase [Armatimonadetes bacterium]|nr:PfkB family carbohydrate kinase [Armatimonadota bacterium]MDW8121232.1 PfkB family carbohydrate kinase [Armatimonadota bacterium]
MERLDVVGIGALNWDCLYQVPETQSDGEVVIENVWEGPGGSSANTVWALARWGLKTGFIGTVGGDQEGHYLIDAFVAVQTDTSRIRIVPDQPTGRVLGFFDPNGHRALYVLPGANLCFRLNPSDYQYCARSQLIHISPLAGREPFEQVRNLVTSLPPSVTVSLAPGSLYSRLDFSEMEPLLCRAQIVFLTKDELQNLTRQSALTDGIKALHDLGVTVIAVTMGTEGSWLSVAGKEWQEQAPQVTVVDGTGAGDAFAAGLLYGYLQGWDWADCLTIATKAAGFCLMAIGPRSGIPSLSSLLNDGPAVEQKPQHKVSEARQ